MKNYDTVTRLKKNYKSSNSDNSESKSDNSESSANSSCRKTRAPMLSACSRLGKSYG